MSNTVQDQIFFFTFMTLRLDTKCLDKNDSIQLDGLRPKVLSFIHYSPLWPSPPKVVSRGLKFAQVEGNEQ